VDVAVGVNVGVMVFEGVMGTLVVMVGIGVVVGEGVCSAMTQSLKISPK
jgi:hypothetical protein